MSYEFNREQNEVFIKATHWMKITGVLVLIGCILGFLGALISSDNGALLTNGLNGVVAVFLIRASTAIDRVVNTEGDDMTHMMAALRSLRGYFFIQAASFLYIAGTLVYYILQKQGMA